jgi:hypothetical protein
MADVVLVGVLQLIKIEQRQTEVTIEGLNLIISVV